MKNLTYNQEFFDNNLLTQLRPLGEASKNEVYDSKNNKIFANNVKVLYNDTVDFDNLLLSQKQGNLIVFTLRSDNIVGYAAASLEKHYQCNHLVFATFLSIYVKPEFRPYSIRFIKFCEENLKNMGVNAVQFGVNPNLKTDKVLKFLGYEVDEVIMIKTLKE